jgi:hypothetical protein
MILLFVSYYFCRMTSDDPNDRNKQEARSGKLERPGSLTAGKLERPESWRDRKAGTTGKLDDRKAGTIGEAEMTGTIAAQVHNNSCINIFHAKVSKSPVLFEGLPVLFGGFPVFFGGYPVVFREFPVVFPMRKIERMWWGSNSNTTGC